MTLGSAQYWLQSELHLRPDSSSTGDQTTQVPPGLHAHLSDLLNTPLTMRPSTHHSASDPEKKHSFETEKHLLQEGGGPIQYVKSAEDLRTSYVNHSPVCDGPNIFSTNRSASTQLKRQKSNSVKKTIRRMFSRNPDAYFEGQTSPRTLVKPSDESIADGALGRSRSTDVEMFTSAKWKNSNNAQTAERSWILSPERNAQRPSEPVKIPQITVRISPAPSSSQLTAVEDVESAIVSDEHREPRVSRQALTRSSSRPTAFKIPGFQIATPSRSGANIPQHVPESRPTTARRRHRDSLETLRIRQNSIERSPGGHTMERSRSETRPAPGPVRSLYTAPRQAMEEASLTIRMAQMEQRMAAAERQIRHLTLSNQALRQQIPETAGRQEHEQAQEEEEEQPPQAPHRRQASDARHSGPYPTPPSSQTGRDSPDYVGSTWLSRQSSTDSSSSSCASAISPTRLRRAAKTPAYAANSTPRANGSSRKASPLFSPCHTQRPIMTSITPSAPLDPGSVEKQRAVALASYRLDRPHTSSSATPPARPGQGHGHGYGYGYGHQPSRRPLQDTFVPKSCPFQPPGLATPPNGQSSLTPRARSSSNGNVADTLHDRRMGTRMLLPLSGRRSTAPNLSSPPLSSRFSAYESEDEL